MQPQVCFEVSAHTGRVHFHLAEDGGNPLGLSLPLDLLLMAGTPSSLQDLLTALDNRCAWIKDIESGGFVFSGL